MAAQRDELEQVSRDIKKTKQEAPLSIEGSTAIIMRNLGIATPSQAKGLLSSMENDIPTHNVSHTKIDEKRLESPNNSMTGTVAQEAAVAELVSAVMPGASHGLVAATTQELSEEKEGKEEGAAIQNDASPVWSAPKPWETPTLRRK